MKGAVIFTGLMVFAAAFTWGADYAFDSADASWALSELQGNDGELELGIDSGWPSYLWVFNTGACSAAGNYFNISTISAYRYIKEIKVFTSAEWPNTAWEGFDFWIHTWNGSVPGSILWGPRFRVPSGGTGWKSCPVNWNFAEGFGYEFVAAAEQCYNYPNCDAFAVDDNPNFMSRSWQLDWLTWSLLEGRYGYRNMMLRVLVANDVGVAPMSLGRVKALYF